MVLCCASLRRVSLSKLPGYMCSELVNGQSAEALGANKSSTPKGGKLPVKTYTGENPQTKSEIRAFPSVL